MFNFFRKNSNGQHKSSDKKNAKKDAIQMADIDGQPLAVGDKVESLRYDLGICEVVEGEIGFDYVSVETGERVSFTRMVDAATSYQKVRKI